MPAAKKSKVVVLKLSPESLRKALPSEPLLDTKPEPPSSTSSTPDEPAAVDASAPAEAGAPALAQSDSADTPAPNGTPTDANAQGAKKKGVPGPKPGAKRTIQQTVDANGAPKPRGKPGPKKKPRPGEMVDGVPFAGPTPIGGAKANPKASQGAINANLRALDRSGAPCRKWERKGFQVRSFTGVAWGVSSWKAPPKSKAELDGDVKSDSSSDRPKQMDSSAVMSEGSMGRTGDTPMGDAVIGSSPAPVGAAAA